MPSKNIPGLYLVLSQHGIVDRVFGVRWTPCPTTKRRFVSRIYYGNGWPKFRRGFLRGLRAIRLRLRLTWENHWIEWAEDTA